MKHVTLDGAKPALRPCRYCGSALGYLGDPKGPHGNGVICADCDRHLGWLPKDKPAGDDFSLIEN